MNDLNIHKCPNCSGQLELIKEIDRYRCPYCEGVYDTSIFDNYDFEYKNEYLNNRHYLLNTCIGCHNQFITSIDHNISRCPICNNQLINENIKHEIKPTKIIPFNIDKNKAIEIYKSYIKNKILLPSVFKQEEIINYIKCFYVPIWLFDGKANISMWFDGLKKEHFEKLIQNSKYKLYRNGDISFKNIEIDGIKQLDISTIKPFDYSKAIDFNDKLDNCFILNEINNHEIRKIINNEIIDNTKDLFLSNISEYNDISIRNNNIKIIDGKQELILCPIWLLNIEYENKNNCFIINGSSVKCYGRFIEDKNTLIIITIFSFIFLFVLFLLLQYLVMR